MKTIGKKVLGFAAVFFVAIFLLAPIFGKLKATEVPELSIVGMNVSYADSVYLVYAVDCGDVNAKTELLVWDEGTGVYEKGTERYRFQKTGTATVSGKVCQTFYVPVPAKKIGDTLYARAYTYVNQEDYLSPVKAYSVLNYAYNKLGYTGTASTDEKFKSLLKSLLSYGQSAQIYFNYKTDELATPDQTFYPVTVEGGILPDKMTSGLFKTGKKVLITATGEMPEGQVFDHWEVDGETVSTEENFEYTVGVEKVTLKKVTRAEGEETYTVIFLDWDGKELSRQTVQKGENAVAPKNPTRDGYNFTGWDKEFKEVQGDLIVTAVYEKQQRMVLKLNSVTAAPGDQNIQISLSIENNPGLLGAILAVSYDDTVMTLTGSTNKVTANGVSFTPPKKYKNPTNFVWDSQDCTWNSDGEILALSFDVLPTAPEGTYNVTLVYNSEDINDSFGNPVDTEGINAEVKVQ